MQHAHLAGLCIPGRGLNATDHYRLAGKDSKGTRSDVAPEGDLASACEEGHDEGRRD